LDEDICQYQSHIKQKLREDNSLPEFEKLMDKNLSWTTSDPSRDRDDPYLLSQPSIHLETLSSPPRKKQKQKP
jgi:hypothetical protein